MRTGGEREPRGEVGDVRQVAHMSAQTAILRRYKCLAARWVLFVIFNCRDRDKNSILTVSLPSELYKERQEHPLVTIHTQQYNASQHATQDIGYNTI